MAYVVRVYGGRVRFRWYLLSICLAVGAPLACAQSTLHIGFGAGTSCAEGCGGDPSVSGAPSAVLDIFQSASRARAIVNPLLILAIPNDTVNLNLEIASETDINPYPAGTSIDGSGSFTLFKSGFHSGDVYSFLGLTGNNSNNFGNLRTAAVSKAGMGDVLSFGVYEFTLHTTLGGKGLANIVFSAPLPQGTFAFGYGGRYDTPFTESGLVDASPVPEPSSILLFLTSVLGIVMIARRRSARRA